MHSVKRGSARGYLLALSLLLSAQPTLAADPVDLEAGFAAPPDSAKPRVWWHWMNGNITQEGIRLDLEWMKRVGLGGFQTFDASRDTPKVVDQRLIYMTPEWKAAFRYATTEANRLGLQMGIAGSPGWSETGGPWVTPAQAMKKLVWSETPVEGGKRFTGPLAAPPRTTGPFQNVPFVLPVNLVQGRRDSVPETFYADAAVIAYRVPSDAATPKPQPRVTSSGGLIDAARLSDGDLATAIDLPFTDPTHPAWIQFDLGTPQPVHAISVAMASDNWVRPRARRAAPPLGTVQVGESAENLRVVAEIPGFGLASVRPPQHTIALTGVRARYVRIVFAAPPSNSAYRTALLDPVAASVKTHRITELVLQSEPRIDRFEEKAGFGTLNDYYADPAPAVGDQAIAKSDVVDLTARMKPDGSVDWNAPRGRWIILRFGYSLIGTLNHPASPEATGLEVDKLSRAHVASYLNQYLDQYQDATGGLMGQRGLENMITDSWEAGISNWTDTMVQDFAQRAGYDITPYLPVLAGRIVGSAAASEKFLWDFRKVIGELVVDNHYGQIAQLLHARGMRQYGESLERERPTLGDGMAMKHRADVPMGAFWVRRAPNEAMPNYAADLRESASVAHVYGQNLVAAESLTANSSTTGWIDSPRTLKPTADQMMVLGLNQFVIHTSVHQPVLGKAPGLTLGVFGQHFNRDETWAEQAKAWVSYLTRSSFLLQQGHDVADIAYFYGEEAPITALFRDGSPPPAVPAGYSFDFINADALEHQLTVTNGRLTTASGASYALIYLGGSSQMMTLATARRLQSLVRSGAILVGKKPEGSPSLADDEAAVRAVLDELWGATPETRSVGLGMVFGRATLGEALIALQIQPDFDYSNPEGKTRVDFVHRRAADADIYFVSNRNERSEPIELSLRMTGKEAEIWRADDGSISDASYRIADGRTIVPIALDPEGAAFIVLRKRATQATRAVRAPVLAESQAVDGPWQVSFPPERGAPARITLARLESWTANAEPGVRYFSGTATYQREITVTNLSANTSGVWLDLGDVREVAEVLVNGKQVGTLWKKPYRLDIRTALRPGRNQLEIRVTNLWPNRLIGDLQPGARPYTFTVSPVYRADSPLLPSGLLGPVTLDVFTPGQT